MNFYFNLENNKILKHANFFNHIFKKTKTMILRTESHDIIPPLIVGLIASSASVLSKFYRFLEISLKFLIFITNMNR